MNTIPIQLPDGLKAWIESLTPEEQVAFQNDFQRHFINYSLRRAVADIQSEARKRGLTDELAEEIMREVLAED